MAQVSRHPLSPIVQERTYEVLFRVLSKLNNPEEVGEFIDEFLTPTEKIVLAKRISIGLLLKKGYLYDQIAKILRVSPTSIAGVAVMLRYSGKAYHRVFDKLLRSEEVEGLFKDLTDAWLNWTPGEGTVISKFTNNRKSSKNKKAF